MLVIYSSFEGDDDTELSRSVSWNVVKREETAMGVCSSRILVKVCFSGITNVLRLVRFDVRMESELHWSECVCVCFVSAVPCGAPGAVLLFCLSDPPQHEPVAAQTIHRDSTLPCSAMKCFLTLPLTRSHNPLTRVTFFHAGHLSLPLSVACGYSWLVWPGQCDS